jgi:hypothetical protein
VEQLLLKLIPLEEHKPRPDWRNDFLVTVIPERFQHSVETGDVC